MRYYIIYLLDGKVVDISSWDEEDARDRQFEMDFDQVRDRRTVQTYSVRFNEVQRLDQVR